MHASQQQVDECSAWSHAFLVSRNLALGSWGILRATSQTIPGGLLELDDMKTVTVVRRDPLAMVENRLQLWPESHCVAQRISIDYDASCHPSELCTLRDQDLDDAAPVPSWAESLLRLGKRWLLRLYAHTPIAHWLDMNAAAHIQNHIALTDCQASWTVFAAPPEYQHEYSLKVQGSLPSSAQVSICIRIEPRRARISVQNMQTCDAFRQDTSPEPSALAFQRSSLRMLASYAIHRKSYILRVHDALQDESNSNDSPPTLTPRRSTELYALEQRWYRQQRFSRGLF